MTEIPARLKDFTPLLDILIQRYGLVTAAVWGRIWRYTQLRDGVCNASLETIAKDLGLGVRTIIRHIEFLETDGYIRDLTPNLRNKPHTYIATNKAQIEIVVGVSESHTEQAFGMPESHSGMPESHSHYATESHEDTSKKLIKKDSTTEEVYKERIKQALITGELEHRQLEDRFFDCFHLNINWQRKSNRIFLNWLKDRPKHQTIETFAHWWQNYDWRGKQGQPPSLDQIQTLWPQAFVARQNPAQLAAEVY